MTGKPAEVEADQSDDDSPHARSKFDLSANADAFEVGPGEAPESGDDDPTPDARDDDQ